MNIIYKITKVEIVKDYTLKISFSDGVVQIIDFGKFLKKSNHPEIKKFLDLKKFHSFNLKSGELMWGDYELLFPIADLYEGKI
jgi:hypothetical protein